jgi:hypothetical protein
MLALQKTEALQTAAESLLTTLKCCKVEVGGVGGSITERCGEDVEGGFESKSVE